MCFNVSGESWMNSNRGERKGFVFEKKSWIYILSSFPIQRNPSSAVAHSIP